MSRTPANILDRPLGGRGSRAASSLDQNVSESAFAYLYSELVQYHQSRVSSISDLERRLESSGYGIGLRMLELLTYRARDSKRETRLMNILQFVSAQVWKSLFGKPADSLERSIDHADEFMIVDYYPITSKYMSVPSDLGQLSVDAYISGIVAGVLDGAGFSARVTAHTVPLEEGEYATTEHYQQQQQLLQQQQQQLLQQQQSSSSSSTPSYLLNDMGLPPRKEKAVFLVKFAPEVLTRDGNMDR